MFARMSQTLLSAAVFLNSPAVHAGVARDTAAPAALEAWVNVVNAQLDEAMDGPPDLYGTVTAFVRRTEDGALAVVRVAPAPAQLTQALRSTLSRIRRLPPIPRGFDPHHLIRVNLLFGGATERSYRAQRRTMMATASDANYRLANHIKDRSVALSHVP